MALQKTNTPGLLKDISTGVVINNNNGEYERILAERQKKREQDDLKMRVQALSVRIDEMSDCIADIRKTIEKVLCKE
jgi:hypothetical protein